MSASVVSSRPALSSFPRRFPAAIDSSCCVHSTGRQQVWQRGCATAASAGRAAPPGEVTDDWLGLVDPEVNSERAVGRGGRAQLRAKVHDMLSIAKKLSGLTTTQLRRIQHLLATPVLEATLRAQAINGTNQGRSREDKLVGKLLRKEHTNEELEAIQEAVQAITAAAGSGKRQTQARALATSWCDRLLDQQETSVIIDTATTGASSASSSGFLSEDAVVAEAEVSEAAVGSGDDVSHFRNLLRRARSAKQSAEVAALTAQEVPSGAQKMQVANKAAKRARSTLFKWLQGIAESVIFGNL